LRAVFLFPTDALLFLRVAAFRAGFAADRLETGVFLVPVAGLFTCALAPLFATGLTPVGRLVAIGPAASASLPGPEPAEGPSIHVGCAGRSSQARAVFGTLCFIRSRARSSGDRRPATL
jgi:hypothetical protein